MLLGSVGSAGVSRLLAVKHDGNRARNTMALITELAALGFVSAFQAVWSLR